MCTQILPRLPAAVIGEKYFWWVIPGEGRWTPREPGVPTAPLPWHSPGVRAAPAPASPAAEAPTHRHLLEGAPFSPSKRMLRNDEGEGRKVCLSSEM